MVITSGRFGVGDVPGLKSVPSATGTPASMNRRAGRVLVLHEEPGRGRQQGRDDGRSLTAAARHRGHALVAGRVEVVRGQRAELGRQLRATGRGELVGVEPTAMPIAGGRLEDPPTLVGCEHALLAEHVARRRPALGGDARQLHLESSRT